MAWCRGLLAAGILAGALPACDDPSGRSAHPARLEARADVGREPLGPLPTPPALDPDLVVLGSKLFEDKRISVDDSLSCASCHDLAHGGADGRVKSLGVGGRPSLVNAPTVYNASLNVAQFWDGRAPTLEAQVDFPVLVEMGSTWDGTLAKLRADPAMVAAFGRARQTLSASGVRAAIAAFERTLITRGSPFDRWLEGEAGALTAEQKAGYETFKSVGCIACHQGSNVGGNMFQRFGVMGDYFSDRGDVVEADYGRYNVTHDAADRFVFRVPSLRNVEHTAPYFHDGTAQTLDEAVAVMAKYQLGRALSDAEVRQITAFLTSLSGPTSMAGRAR